MIRLDKKEEIEDIGEILEKAKGLYEGFLILGYDKDDYSK